MNFVSIRDIRIKPSQVWQQLQEEGDLLLTSNGRPLALMVSLEDENPEELMAALRQARAQRAIAQMRMSAAQQGLDALTLAEIDEEIAQARRDRAAKLPS